jgi:hypothetical protein
MLIGRKGNPFTCPSKTEYCATSLSETQLNREGGIEPESNSNNLLT